MKKQYTTGGRREGYKVRGERVKGERVQGSRFKDFEDKKPTRKREALSDKREGYKVKGERVKGERVKGERYKDFEDKKPTKRRSDNPASLRGARSEPKQPRNPRRFNEPRSKDFEDRKPRTRVQGSRSRDFEDRKPSVRREALSDKREGGRRKAEGGKSERYRVKGEGYKVKGERVQGSRFKDAKPTRKRETDDSSRAPRRSDKPASLRGSRSEPKQPRNPRSTDKPTSLRGSRSEPKQPRHSSREGVRLNKFIANSGICSRREADEYIVAGLVSVNGQIVTELGVKVQPGDDVRFNGERLKGEQKVYIVMNKPKDFVTTMSDPHAEKTVMDLIGENCPERVFPVGRLDKATTGVLLFTNDGELAEQLTHPSYNKKKIYHIFLDKNLKSTDLQQLLDGVELEDGLSQADSISYIDGDNAQVGLEIHSGRNRVVRRMFEALNYKVKKLDRVYFAGLTKKNLKRGQWRFLTDTEVNMLRMGAYE